MPAGCNVVRRLGTPDGGRVHPTAWFGGTNVAAETATESEAIGQNSDDFPAAGNARRRQSTPYRELDSDGLTIETLDVDYEDIDFLHSLDVTNTMRCIKHIKNCAIQNVFKIYNWWSQRQKKLYQI
ncbi:hypothetical protein ALC62_10507 [Cyphomyrmex costatus]|uniref:Uncharacterized protein n=1 Tax=Cyphomyrmex costatus TaxID=456900 RepID=A0A151IDJ2_9HYME|nr:hypothetical protein ALC62_10507 [Cyphomyrmex costatus]